MTDRLNIRDAEERARENLGYGADGRRNALARDVLAIAAVYREAVEALEQAKSYAEQLELLAYDDAQQIEKHAVILEAESVLAKARAALGEKEQPKP